MQPAGKHAAVVAVGHACLLSCGVPSRTGKEDDGDEESGSDFDGKCYSVRMTLAGTSRWCRRWPSDLVLHVGSCGLAALLAWARDTDDDDFDDDEDEDEADTLPNGCDQMLYDKVGHRRC